MPFTARIPPLFFPSLFSLHISSPLGVIYNSLSPRCRLNIYNKMLDLPIALVSRLWSSPDFSSRGHQQFRVSTATGWIAMMEKANLEEEEETTTLARRCRCAAFWNSLEQNGVGHVMLHRDAQWNRGVRGLGLFFFVPFLILSSYATLRHVYHASVCGLQSHRSRQNLTALHELVFTLCRLVALT